MPSGARLPLAATTCWELRRTCGNYVYPSVAVSDHLLKAGASEARVLMEKNLTVHADSTYYAGVLARLRSPSLTQQGKRRRVETRLTVCAHSCRAGYQGTPSCCTYRESYSAARRAKRTGARSVCCFLYASLVRTERVACAKFWLSLRTNGRHDERLESALNRTQTLQPSGSPGT